MPAVSLQLIFSLLLVYHAFFCTLSLYAGGHLGRVRVLLHHVRALGKGNSEQHSSGITLKWSSAQKGKFHFNQTSLPPLPHLACYFFVGERVTSFDRCLLTLSLGSPLPLPPCSLLGHIIGPRRLVDHSGGAALPVYVQWACGFKVASCYSWLPTVEIPASGRAYGKGRFRWAHHWILQQVSVCLLKGITKIVAADFY